MGGRSSSKRTPSAGRPSRQATGWTAAVLPTTSGRSAAGAKVGLWWQGRDEPPRCANMLVDEAELEARRKALPERPFTPDSQSPWQEIFRERVLQENGQEIYAIDGLGRYGDSLILMAGRYRRVR